MEGRTEQRDDGWALVLPGQADGLQNEVTGFPTHQAAAQALRLVALHAAIVAGQPPDEVQRLRGELEVRAGKAAGGWVDGHLLPLPSPPLLLALYELDLC